MKSVLHAAGLSFLCLFVFIHKSFSQKSLDKYQSVFDNELKEWTKSFKNFNLHSFTNDIFNTNPDAPKVAVDTVVDSSSLVTTININDSAWKVYMDTYKPILSFSPDSSKFIDIYSDDLNLEKRNDSIFRFGSGGWEIIYLYDLNNKTKTELFHFGFYKIAQDVAWINNDEFLIATIETADYPRIAKPIIYLGYCKNGTALAYHSSDTACCVPVRRSGLYSSPKLNNIKMYEPQ